MPDLKKLKPEPPGYGRKAGSPAWIRSIALMLKHQLVEFYSFYMCVMHVVETEIVRDITLFVWLFTYLRMLLKLLNQLLVSFLYLSESWGTPSNLATSCPAFHMFYFSMALMD